MVQFGEFLKACGQTELPDRSVLIGQKLVENAKFKKFKCDILGDSNTMLFVILHICKNFSSWTKAKKTTQKHLSKMSSSNWSQKLFGCTNDIETCKNRLLLQFTIVYATLVLGCCGAFCGPCLMCRNAGYLDKSGFLCCFLGVLLPCIPFFLLRGATREKYNIEVHTYIS